MESEWNIFIDRKKCPYLNMKQLCEETGAPCGIEICPRIIEFIER